MRFALTIFLALFLIGGTLSLALSDSTDEILKELIEQSEQGDAKAILDLGLMYSMKANFTQEKETATKNYKKALFWYKKSADNGDPEGQYFLAQMYRGGKGTEQDYKQAFFWFKKAAKQDSYGSQLNLGRMYRDGKGVTKDYKQALFWLKKAADNGKRNAAKEYKELKQKLAQQ